MNEHLWLTETDPLVLLNDLYPLSTLDSGQPQTRACRLYLLACARRQWDRLPGVCRVLVELGEQYVEAPRERVKLWTVGGRIAEELLHSDVVPGDHQAAIDRLTDADLLLSSAARLGPPHPPLTPSAWRKLAALVYLPFVPNTPPFTWVPAELHDAGLLREIYYNPYRRVPFDPAWRTADVLSLARQMYDSRGFGTMPILADALQDAGCDNEDILSHCRNAPANTHVRGCWVLDRVLNRG